MRPNPQPPAALGCSWEELWAPYDESSYQAVLASITPQDALLEIGAGDLRLARRMAEIAGRVYAVEIQKALIEKAYLGGNLPSNLQAIHADARAIPFPRGITAAVLLMRHCNHFDLYVKKLTAAGCNRLITNARWGCGVEVIDLQAPRQSFAKLDLGWYACLCGAIGFKTGPLELLEADTAFDAAEVRDCPGCHTTRPSAPNLSQIKWKEHGTGDSIPVFPNLPTDIKTLYLEGA